jgi:hypothetical protein
MSRRYFNWSILIDTPPCFNASLCERGFYDNGFPSFEEWFEDFLSVDAKLALTEVLGSIPKYSCWNCLPGLAIIKRWMCLLQRTAFGKRSMPRENGILPIETAHHLESRT